MENIIVEKVWLTDTEVWIRTTDGKEACVFRFPKAEMGYSCAARKFHNEP